MSGENMENSDNIKKLELAQNIRDYHRKSLIDLERHFSWLVSIILSLQMVIYTNIKLLGHSREIPIVTLSIIGSIISVTAISGLRREYGYLRIAYSQFSTEYEKVFKKKTSFYPPERTFLSVRVTTSFQILFALAILLFIIIAVCTFVLKTGEIGAQ